MNNLERLPLDSLSVVASTIEPSTQCFWSSLSVWQCLWRSLTKALLRANELRVWQRFDRFGNLYWQAYDPATGRSTCSGSEAELKIWIEELRYHK